MMRMDVTSLPYAVVEQLVGDLNATIVGFARNGRNVVIQVDASVR